MQRKTHEPRRPNLDLSGLVPVHQLGQILVDGSLVQLLDFGAWDATIGYQPGNVVTDGTQWLCIAANTNQEPPNATYWQPYDPTVLALAPDQIWHSVGPGGWTDITSDLVVSRVSGGDIDPDISNIATKAFLFEIGGLAGLKVVKLKIQLGSGGAGSGTSQYLVQGLGVQSIDNMYAGRGYIRQTSMSSQPIYGCQLIGLGTGDLGILWDGAPTAVVMGPTAGNAPFNFAAGDTIFDGLAFLQ